MASTSNSIIHSSGSSSYSSAVRPKNRYYDVFVSFRGIDTRYNFTDHLFAALRRKGITAFRDDTKLQKGEFIAPELLRAIEASHIYVVVFSKNYASSTWCLRELQYIFECVRGSGKRVLPVFYDVDPSDVRKQSGSYAEDFAKHEERFKQDLEMMVHRWRKALTQAANLSGWDVRDKPQSVVIEKIVEEIMNILGHKFSSLPKDLVGMHSHVEALEKLLLLDSIDNVRAVGISGMGGIGKTTLATVLYDRISHQFDACCFIDDISKIYRDDGPIGVQKQILHQTLGEENLQMCNLYNAANLMRSRLRRVRALIILDNVNQVEQLEKLAVNREWLGAGSRIIIVSRDEHILKDYEVDVVYKVPILNETNSRQLFSRKAFKLDSVIRNYEDLANGILSYANGLPLAIKVLGSFLFGRDISEWRSALVRLRESPNKDIMDVLRLSFDGLEEMEKEIFLDIACFFNYNAEEYVKNVLKCCGFHPDIGLKVLIDKSLISKAHTLILMHPLLKELGRKIVQENSTNEPRKWSRLWLHKNFYNVISENMEKNVEAIVLNREGEILMAKALSKMKHLRLLILNRVNISGSLICLSNELRYIEWYRYPFMYLPSSFQPNALGQMILEDSNIKQLWEGKKYLPNLRTLNLRHSKNLIKMPGFGEVPNLEELNLEGCVKLAKVDPSIGLLQKLVLLSLKDCKNLRSIPNNIFSLSSLEYLNLSGCSKVFENPMHLKRVDTSESALHSQSTSSIFKWITLPFHSLYPTPKAHRDLAGFLSPSLASFSCLRILNIRFCNLSQIPDAVGCIYWLEGLNLGGNNFVTLPSLKELSKLVYLNLEHCKHLKSLPEFPSPLAATRDQYRRAAGLYIFNCPELGEGKHCFSMTFSWMIQFIRANNEPLFPFNHIGIIISGSEMSSWFSNQSESNSISMDPSPIIDDNNIIGVACCAVFSVAPYDPTTMTRNERCCTSLAFQSRTAVEYRIPVIVDIDLFKVESNHMWLIYFTRKSFLDTVSFVNAVSFVDVEPPTDLDDIKRGGIKMVMHRRSPHVGVKNCGYRWVYKQDLQQVNLTMMHSNGDQLARKRNFFVIEDEAQPQDGHSSD